MANVIEINNLATSFYTNEGVVKAVDGISYVVEEGETLGIVGESGCGKSVSALSLMRLITDPPGKIIAGQVLFEGRDLLTLSETEMRMVRGNRIGMVFQEPMTSLNPVLTIERQLTETLELHLNMTRRQARHRAEELLEIVGIPDASQRLNSYPHQMSGGMRQRVMIAMAISCRPRLIIADEPTTALDVTIQAQILELMQSLCNEFGTALVLITHNLGVIARYAQRVVVMYAGKIIEVANSHAIYEKPLHPYTVGLLKSVPRLDSDPNVNLVPIEGLPPKLVDMPDGCSFAPRCLHAITRCKEQAPSLMPVGVHHESACWRSEEIAENSDKFI